MSTSAAKVIENEKLKPVCNKQNQDVPHKDLLVAVMFLSAYIACCLLVAVLFQLDKALVVIIGLLVVIAGSSGLWLYRRHVTQQQKQQGSELLHQVFGDNFHAFIVTDDNGKTLYCNDNFKKLCNAKDRHVPTLLEWTKILSDSDQVGNILKKLAKQAKLKSIETAEIFSATEDGGCYYMITARSVDGVEGGICWQIEDVTAQHERERTLREEREKLIDFTDNSPVGFFSVNEEGRFLFVNATLARWLGNDIKRLLSRGRLHTYLDTPPDNARPYDILPKGGARQMGEILMKGPGGKTFLASVSQTVVAEDDGRVRTRGVVHDLTQEREMRQALEASEDRFQRFFEEAPLGIVLVNQDGEIKDCNVAFSGLVDIAEKKLEGTSLSELIKGDNKDEILSAVKEIEQGQNMTVPVETVLMGKGGKKIQCADACTTVQAE